MTRMEKLAALCASGALERADVEALLRWQISLPAEQADCALAADCALTLLSEEDKEELKARENALHDALMTQIRGKTMKKKRMARYMAAAALLLALCTAGAAAYGVTHGVLNFALQSGEPAAALGGAEALVTAGTLATAKFDHCAVEVREAAFDGGELRVMYAITPLEGDIQGDGGSYVVPGAEQDGVHMCDYILVNGQTAYIDEMSEVLGDDGAVLYYLQTNLGEWGVDVSGAQALMIGLPLLPRESADSRVQPTLDFTISANVPQGTARSASLVAAEAQGQSILLESAAFSPIRGEVTLLVEGADARTLEKTLDDFPYAEDALERELPGTRYAGCFEDADGGARFTVVFDPPEDGWPETATLILLRRDGPPDWAIELALEK